MSEKTPTNEQIKDANECPSCDYFGICPSHKWIHNWLEEQRKDDLIEMRTLRTGPQIKYVVHPGWVRSINDRERHFITFSTLCRLYGVLPQYCIDASDEHSIRGINLNDFQIHLYPDEQGNYALVSCESVD